MDHVRGAHDVLWVVKSASIEQFVPPWTVRRQVWSDSLKASHSGISTDVLLFSDINLSLVHHYRIHRRGLPHIAFRKDYMCRLRALLPPAVAQSREGMLSPVTSGPVPLRHARPAELGSESPGEPDVPSGGFGQYESWGSRSVTFRFERYRILRTCRVLLYMTVGLRCYLCLCNFRILGCYLYDKQLFQPAWLRHLGRTV